MKSPGLKTCSSIHVDQGKSFVDDLFPLAMHTLILESASKGEDPNGWLAHPGRDEARVNSEGEQLS